MNAVLMPGFGDSATWPLPTGHANDLRTEPSEADAIREAMRLAEHYMGRAERALPDINAALDLLGSAMRELGEVATTGSDA
jgi:hypothetical protein